MQVPSPGVSESIGGPLLDYTLTVLAVVLSPVASRQQFLQHTKPAFLAPAAESVNSNVWVVMDSSGDEDEDMAETWCNLDEQDIVDVSSALYFGNIFFLP